MRKRMSMNSKRGTFFVNILYCENSTWQGYVVLTGSNKRMYFKSALELIMIINEALGQNEIRNDIYSEMCCSEARVM